MKPILHNVLQNTEAEGIFPVVGWVVAPKKDWPLKCDVIWKKGLWRCNYFKDLEIISSWVKVDLKSNDNVLRREEKERTETKKACENGCRIL